MTVIMNLTVLLTLNPVPSVLMALPMIVELKLNRKLLRVVMAVTLMIWCAPHPLLMIGLSLLVFGSGLRVTTNLSCSV